MTISNVTDAKEFLKKLDAFHEKTIKDQRATANYWNGDDWGSISGHRDASDWVERQLAEFVVNYRAKPGKGVAHVESV